MTINSNIVIAKILIDEDVIHWQFYLFNHRNYVECEFTEQHMAKCIYLHICMRVQDNH